MSRVIQTGTGAQVLPPAEDERLTVSTWAAWLACTDADLRTRCATYRDLAASLHLTGDTP